MENIKEGENIDLLALNEERRVVMVTAHESEVARIVAVEMINQGTLPESVLGNTQGSVMTRDAETGEIIFYLIGREAYEHEKMKYSNKEYDV